MGSLFTSDKAKTESTPLPRLRRRMFEIESASCDLNEESGNSKRKGDSQDLISSDMTLKELQERYKKKKKLQESASSREQHMSTVSFGDMKQDDANVKIKDEESDLEIPLSAWKRKVSNKVKRSLNKKLVWPSSEPEVSVADRVLSGSEDQLSTVYNKRDPPNTHAENIKSEHSDFLTSAHSVANGSTFGSLFINDDCQVLPEEVNKGVIGDIEKTGSSILVTVDHVAELTNANHVANLFRGNNLEEPIPASQDSGSDMLDNHKGCLLQSQISCQINCDIANEFDNGGDATCEIDNDGDTASFGCNDVDNIESLHMSPMDPVPHFNPHNDAGSDHKDSPLAEAISVCTTDGPIYASADEGLECLLNISPIEVFDSQRETQINCTPRRLLSTRKFISPNSQEKLRQAMNIQEHYDNMGKPRSDFEGVTITNSQVGEKLRNNINLSPQAVPKGILKAVPFSVGTPQNGTESSSVPSRAQKAVAFSQRQMQDIESLAAKLMQELKAMKGIVEESLNSKECSSTPAYTADEMRSAVQNAAEVEETTKRWLSMMGRDCNRFCKIMKSTGKRSAASPVSAERKKIVFADEAGGSLCHVKILDNIQDPACP